MSLKSNPRQRFGPSIQWLGYRSGLMRVTGRLAGPGGAIVLMYHSVARPDDARWIDPHNHVPADAFEWQMRFLQQHRNVVPLGKLVEWIMQGRAIPDGTVVITFDDGYRDNLTVAAPILARLGLPATLFLPTGYIDRGETQWVDQAYTAFQNRSAPVLPWGANGREFQLADSNERGEAYGAVCEDLLVAAPAERQRLLAALVDRLQPSAAPPRLTLNWTEVGQLLETCEMGIGGHTVEHTDLTAATVGTARDEIASCKVRIRDMIGAEVRHFSFCYGRSSEELRRILPEFGIESACASRPGDRVVTMDTDPLRLPRIAATVDPKHFEVSICTANRALWRKLGR